MTTMPAIDAELAALAAHMARRRDQVMQAWRHAVKADAELASATALPREQLHDHLPALLMDFEQALATGSKAAHAALGPAPRRDAAAHGLKRWQQGFDLAEVARELGRLNECMVAELDACCAAFPQLSPPAMAMARALWARMCSLAVSASTAQYDKLRQGEAADQINDLETALVALRELEQQRADLWQQAAHDLRGNLGVVANASAGLSSANATPAARDSFLRLLDRNVAALHGVLDDVASLARLQGGHAKRRPAALDAALLLRTLLHSFEPQAHQRELTLQAQGPDTLVVEGDAAMTQRIVHHLLLDAMRHSCSGSGSVTLVWGTNHARDGQRWFVEVRDTGPHRRALDTSRIADSLRQANQQPQAAAGTAAAATDCNGNGQGDGNGNGNGTGSGAGHGSASAAPNQGIGLAIVKRLCEVLDAALEVDSAGDGTTFRILLPLRYSA